MVAWKCEVLLALSVLSTRYAGVVFVQSRIYIACTYPAPPGPLLRLHLALILSVGSPKYTMLSFLHFLSHKREENRDSWLSLCLVPSHCLSSEGYILLSGVSLCGTAWEANQLCMWFLSIYYDLRWNGFMLASFSLISHNNLDDTFSSPQIIYRGRLQHQKIPTIARDDDK